MWVCHWFGFVLGLEEEGHLCFDRWYILFGLGWLWAHLDNQVFFFFKFFFPSFLWECFSSFFAVYWHLLVQRATSTSLRMIWSNIICQSSRHLGLVEAGLILTTLHYLPIQNANRDVSLKPWYRQLENVSLSLSFTYTHTYLHRRHRHTRYLRDIFNTFPVFPNRQDRYLSLFKPVWFTSSFQLPTGHSR